MVAFGSLSHHSVDRELENRVLQDLHRADPLRFRNVTVSARQGVVVLLGSVNTPHAKSVGFQQARRTPGVESVIDALQVGRPSVLSN